MSTRHFDQDSFKTSHLHSVRRKIGPLRLLLPVFDLPEERARNFVEVDERKLPVALAGVAAYFCSNFFLTFGYFLADFKRLVLGCIEANVCK